MGNPRLTRLMLAAGTGLSGVSVNLTRTTTGLVLADDFNRAAASAVGNGWSEAENADSLQIAASNNLEMSQTTAGVHFIYRNDLAIPADGICEIRVKTVDATGGWAPFVYGTLPVYANPGNNVGYMGLLDRAGTKHHVYEVDTQLAEVVDAGIGTNEWWRERLVWEVSGSDKLVRSYALETTEAGAPADLVAKVTNQTDTTPLTDAYFGVRFWKRCFVNVFFLCGRNIVVNNIPTGFKVQLDSETAVTESGGTVTIDADAKGLPFTTIKILDGDDVQQDSLTPSGGIYGGDIYSAS